MAGYRLAERGGLPVELPDVVAGHDASPERIGGTFTTLAGTRRQHTVRWARTWPLVFAGQITDAQWELVRSWTDPALRGRGPFELYEPDQTTPSCLVNVAAVTRERVISDRNVVSMILVEV